MAAHLNLIVAHLKWIAGVRARFSVVWGAERNDPWHCKERLGTTRTFEIDDFSEIQMNCFLFWVCVFAFMRGTRFLA